MKRIAVIGDYNPKEESHRLILESIKDAAAEIQSETEAQWIMSDALDVSGEHLKHFDGFWFAPGSPYRNADNVLSAIQYARENRVPALGTCAGFQHMVIEFARNVLGYQDANSSEMDPDTPHNVIDMMEEQKTITQMGGTMRRGAYECELVTGSRTWQAYGEETLIRERHRHRYEFNNQYMDEFEQHGMHCVGINPEADLVEIVEIPTLKWYIGTQFHPEYSSTVLRPHPLFMSFMKACIEDL